MKSLCVRQALAVIALVLMLAPQGLAQEKAPKKGEQPVLVDASVGYTSYYNVVKAGHWYPVWVTIKPQSYDLRGRVSIEQTDGELRVEAPVQIPKGVAQRFLMFFRFDEGLSPEIVVTLEARRLGREQFSVPLRWAAPREQHVLVLAEKAGGFSFLNRQAVQDEHDPDATSANRKSNPNARVRPSAMIGGIQPANQSAAFGGTAVAYGDVALLPEHAIALGALDAIIINSPALRELTEGQWRALRDWMAEGGRLLLAGGRYQPFIEQSQLRGVYGFDPAAGAQVELPALGTLEPATIGTMKTIASLPAQPGEEVRLSVASMPLVTGKRVGRGWFYYSALALDPPVLDWINGMDDAQGFWLRLLERHWTGTPLADFWESDVWITESLEQSFNFKLAGAGWFFNFIGLYILLVLPVNWYVCRKIGRREWTWPVAVALALCFSAYGYSSGLSRQGKNMAASELTALRRLEGEDTAHVKTWNGIYSPRRLSADFALPMAGFPYSPKTQVTSFRGPRDDLFAGRPLTVMFGGDATRITDLYFFPWSTRRVAAEYLMPVEGKVEAIRALAADGGNWAPAGALRNGTPWTFKYWMITDGQGTWTSELPLAAGDEEDVSKLGRSPSGLVPHLFERLTALGRGHAGAVGENPYGTAMSQASHRFGSRHWQESDPRKSEWFFVGIAEEGISPVVDAMAAGSRIGLLVYEQSLGSEARTAAGQSPKWSARIVHMGTSDADEMYGWRGGNHVPMSGAPATGVDANPPFAQANTDIRLVPDRDIVLRQWRSLSVEFKIESFPDREKVYEVQGYGNNPELPRKWRLSVCPVSVFNWKTWQWEQMPAGSQLWPVENYLEPATQAIQLRVFAGREHMVYQSVEEETGKAPIVKLAKDIWPSAYMQNQPHFFQLADLNVKLEPAVATHEGAEQ